MERRAFLKVVGLAGAFAPVMATSSIVSTFAPPRPGPQELRTKNPGEILQSADWNQLIDRVNQLTQAVL